MSRSIVVPIPPEVEPYEAEIRRFVHAMVHKLKVHHKKGKWEDATIDGMLLKLTDEVDELNEAVESGNIVEILNESADVANFSMIISAIALAKP